MQTMKVATSNLLSASRARQKKVFPTKTPAQNKQRVNDLNLSTASTIKQRFSPPSSPPISSGDLSEIETLAIVIGKPQRDQVIEFKLSSLIVT